MSDYTTNFEPRFEVKCDDFKWVLEFGPEILKLYLDQKSKWTELQTRYLRTEFSHKKSREFKMRRNQPDYRKQAS